jgi:O-antigen ligase
MTQVRSNLVEGHASQVLPVSESRSRRKKGWFPKSIYFLFYIFAVYLVIPAIDVPLLGLSISAPVFFLNRSGVPAQTSTSVVQAVLQLDSTDSIDLVCPFSSALLPMVWLSGGVEINSDGILYLIRYFYWLMVFVLTGYFANQDQLLKKIPLILAWSVFILALLRWGEVLLHGNIGAWSGTYLLTENAYGFQFSVFSPFLLVLIFQQKGWKKVFWILGEVVVWGAVAINASRGSWVAMGIGLGICLLLLFFSKPQRFITAVFSVLLMAGIGFALWNEIPKAAAAVEERLGTFQNLEEDKSYVIRQVMIQKGLRLFKDSPLVGVGANRFTLNWADIDLPDILEYRGIGEFETKNAHNSYIQWLAEFGLLGSIPLVILLAVLTIRGLITTRRAIVQRNLVPLAIYLSFLQMSIHMWVITALTGTVTWFIYGLLMAVIKNEANKK